MPQIGGAAVMVDLLGLSGSLGLGQRTTEFLSFTVRTGLVFSLSSGDSPLSPWFGPFRLDCLGFWSWETWAGMSVRVLMGS